LGAAVVSLVFFPIYLGGAATTGFLDHRLHLYRAWELALPFWPMMIVPYLSMFLLFLMPPLQLDEPELAELVGLPHRWERHGRRRLPLPAHGGGLCGANRRRDLAGDL
jgi:hypothetical protein